MFKPLAKEIREQILSRIKNKGVTANQAAKDAGVSPKTVYDWLAKEATGDPNVVAYNRLKKENEGSYHLIGKLTSELTRIKKGRWPR